MQRICLQIIGNSSQEEIIEKLHSTKLFTLEPAREEKSKRKITLGCERVKLLRQYSRTDLKLKRHRDIEVRLENGVYIVNDNVINQKEFHISYAMKEQAYVRKIIQTLLQQMNLVLIEPDLEYRIQQMQGCFYPAETKLYQEQGIWGAVWVHFSWLVYVVNGAWARYLENPLDKRTLRQLRVRLRWLRSMLSFFRPLFKEPRCSTWRKRLRNSGVALGHLREMDVMLLSLDRLAMATADTNGNKGKLSSYFQEKRQEHLLTVEKNISLQYNTLELASFLLWLQTQPLLPDYSQADFKEFVTKRLRKWVVKLIALTERKEILKDMKKAHSTRIRIKKLRYVLMSLAEFRGGNDKLLPQLKKFQDLLGVMHDDYTNGLLVRKLSCKEQREEVLLFSGWESAKVESLKIQLEESWSPFGETLREWERNSLR